MALTSILKSVFRAAGAYRRVLARTSFPGVAVLTYHAVPDDSLTPDAIPFSNLHVRASTFAAHCAVVRELCNPISLDDWRAALAGGPPLPPRPVLIAFDDGYRSVLKNAAPVLAALELPAVVFACSGPSRTGSMLWFDGVAAVHGEAAVEAWKSRTHTEWMAVRQTLPVADDDPRAVMSPVELARLSAQRGIEVAAHTVSHPILARAGVPVQREEICESRRQIEEWIGRPVRAFAYPNGRPGVDYTAETVDVLRAAGFDCAFTTRSRFARPEEDALERSRFTMVNEVTATELAHRLAYAWHT